MTSVLVLTVEKDGSSRCRLEYPARALQAQGADVKIRHAAKGGTFPDADVIVVNRPVRELQARLVLALVDSGHRVVVDMDDDLDDLSPDHSMFGLDTFWLHGACRVASAVTVSTPGLLDIYGYGHGVVVRNRIPESMLTVGPKPHVKPFVGWYGTVGSHPNDLQQCGLGVKAAMFATGAEFIYTGPQVEIPRLRDALLLHHEVIQATGWYHDRALFAKAVASATVGIVPLENTMFNWCKSWLKGLEFAACGVPFVASPTEEYLRLSGMGAGVTATTTLHWKRWLTSILRNPDLHEELVVKGREVASNLTYEKGAGEYWDAWVGAR